VSRAQKRILNQHLHRHHNQAHMNEENGNLLNRLALHEQMHKDTICDHDHGDYSDATSFIEELLKDA
jgi:hypothetical protein